MLTLTPRSRQKWLLVLRGRETGLPVLACVKPCQSSGEDNLSSEGRFDIAGKDGAVAYLRCDNLINREQWALPEVGLAGFGIGIGGGRAGGFAVEVSGVMIAPTVDVICVANPVNSACAPSVPKIKWNCPFVWAPTMHCSRGLS